MTTLNQYSQSVCAVNVCTLYDNEIFLFLLPRLTTSIVSHRYFNTVTYHDTQVPCWPSVIISCYYSSVNTAMLLNSVRFYYSLQMFLQYLLNCLSILWQLFIFIHPSRLSCPHSNTYWNKLHDHRTNIIEFCNNRANIFNLTFAQGDTFQLLQ